MAEALRHPSASLTSTARARSTSLRAGSVPHSRYNNDVQLDDTIVAISTPPGRGGIGVVRLAGDEAYPIAMQLLRLRAGRELQAGHAQFCELIEPATGER